MSGLNTAPTASETPAARWEREARELAGATKALARELARDAAPFIGVFGSARGPESAPGLHEQCGHLGEALGRAIANAGWSMMTGGCPGIVDTAQRVFCTHRADAARQKSVGVRITCLGFDEPANRYLDTTLHAPDFGSRLELMLQLCEAFIVLPGGVGSLLEVAYFLQHLQAVPAHRNKPIYLIGEVWLPLLELLRGMAQLGTVNQTDVGLVRVVTNVNDVVTIIEGLRPPPDTP